MFFFNTNTALWKKKKKKPTNNEQASVSRTCSYLLSLILYHCLNRLHLPGIRHRGSSGIGSSATFLLLRSCAKTFPTLCLWHAEDHSLPALNPLLPLQRLPPFLKGYSTPLQCCRQTSSPTLPITPTRWFWIHMQTFWLCRSTCHCLSSVVRMTIIKVKVIL